MKNLFKRTLVTACILMCSQFVQAEGNVLTGKEKSVVCAACHGADGNSLIPTFPKLAGLGEKYLVKQMQDIKSGNLKVVEMTGMLTALSEQDMLDIAAHFTSNPIKATPVTTGDLELGQKIYQQGITEKNVPACIACHLPTGAGNNVAGFPAVGGQHVPYLVKQLQAYRTGAKDPAHETARTNDGEARIMRNMTAQMSDQEIEAVSSYISGLQ